MDTVEFVSFEETARCIYSGPGLILDIEHSKICKTESLTLRNTQSSD